MIDLNIMTINDEIDKSVDSSSKLLDMVDIMQADLEDFMKYDASPRQARSLNSTALSPINLDEDEEMISQGSKDGERRP